MMRSQESVVEARQTITSLPVLSDLFDRLHRDGIDYCHWKSNEHLGDSLRGDSDLDLLVSRRSTGHLRRILAEAGFKPFVARPGRGYPGIEDYLGFDAPTGRLTHLHLHYQLTVGEAFLKGYRIPWEDAFITHRAFDRHHGVYIADPNLELILLMVRASLKLRTRDRLREVLGRPYFRGSLQRELQWLIRRTEQDRIERFGHELIGEAATRHLLQMIAGPTTTLRHVRAFKRSCAPPLDEFRMYSATGALGRRWLRELQVLLARIEKKLFAAGTGAPRTPRSGGLVIAFLGADGAGKSTVARAVVRWLAPQSALISLYGGSGAGPVSMSRKLLQLAAILVRRLRDLVGARTQRTRTENTSQRGGDGSGPSSRWRTLWHVLWVLALARERRIRAMKARRARDRGMIVVFDRLPQNQFAGLNDGPHLSGWLDSNQWLLRRAAILERESYRSAELCVPDLVIKLQVSPETALARRPTTRPDRLRQKLQIVKALRYPPSTGVLEVDADRPADDVLLTVQRAIWEWL